MYDRPETRAANDRLWQSIREGLANAPETLTRNNDLWSQWTSPDLTLSQTCGLPFRKALNAKTTLVGAPIHDLPCPPGRYLSALVVRASDPRRSLAEYPWANVAVNAWDSQSGWCALLEIFKDHNVTPKTSSPTGSHLASAQAVASGAADLAAIDAVTWNMIHRWDPFAKDLRVLAHTLPTPALPYITARGNDPVPIRRAISQAIRSLTTEDRDALCLTGITEISRESYTQLPIPPEPCVLPENP